MGNRTRALQRVAFLGAIVFDTTTASANAAFAAVESMAIDSDSVVSCSPSSKGASSILFITNEGVSTSREFLLPRPPSPSLQSPSSGC